ncbi:sensor histidine kinase [Filimonas lacunae]|nr:HAMP domain-containing sensor histidine kinase [Filimonas lacunae]
MRKVYRPWLLKSWTFLTGEPAAFTVEEQSFNAVCAVSLAILTILLPFNAIIGLWDVSLMMFILIVLLVFFYYQARFKHRFTLGIIAYASASYITLILNFFFNSGTLGPTLFLFFLTFQLLIAFSKRHLHVIWFACHLLIAATLVIVEILHPTWIPYTYSSNRNRFVDIISSYLVILVCMYVITIYLRNSFTRERKTVEAHAAKISRQNQQLEYVNAQKNKLFSVLAHDLQSPFNSIKQIVELLTTTQLNEQDKALFMGHLKEATTNTSEMLSNLLSWSYSQLQGTQLHIQSVSVYSVVEAVLRVQQSLAQKKDIRIAVELPPQHTVLADYNMLEIVLRNLVNNAIKFTPSGGVITIGSQMQQDICCITVQDTGMGIPADTAAQLFTFNLTSTRGTGNEKGIGLGLTLCREFVELQNGRIEAESAMNEGSAFRVFLPAGSNA